MKNEPQEIEFYSYRGHLPHVRVRGAAYFVTWRLHPDQPDLEPEERTAVTDAIRFFNGKRYEVSAFVVMNDHVHVLLRPIAGFALESILHSLKSFTSRTIQKDFGRTGSLWQRESFDRAICSEKEFLEKGTYIANNPRKRWPDLVSYTWVWP